MALALIPACQRAAPAGDVAVGGGADTFVPDPKAAAKAAAASKFTAAAMRAGLAIFEGPRP